MIFALYLLGSEALANGQTAHLWITEAALTELPTGELQDFLQRDDLRPMLRNGAMFPDGGYPLGDDYAEIAHWEPFQDLYLQWIMQNYSAPWTDEAAQHIAFLFGMASHGMADQSHDATYMEKAKEQDASSDWTNDSMDEATDVALVGEVGGQDVPEEWVPYDLFVELYAEAGHTVTVSTLMDGQSLLQVAVAGVEALGGSASMLEKYHAQFPWATSHLFDPDERGNPPNEAEVVARYWQVLWSRLHDGDWRDDPVLYTWPADGGYGQATDATTVDGRVGIVFSRGLDDEQITAADFVVESEDGEIMPVSPRVFYGFNAHIALLTPDSDWAEDTRYTVTATGIDGFDGTDYAGPWSTTFSTAAPPVVEDTGTVETAEGCGCATSGQAVGWLWGIAGALVLARRRRPTMPHNTESPSSSHDTTARARWSRTGIPPR